MVLKTLNRKILRQGENWAKDAIAWSHISTEWWISKASSLLSNQSVDLGMLLSFNTP